MKEDDIYYLLEFSCYLSQILNIYFNNNNNYEFFYKDKNNKYEELITQYEAEINISFFNLYSIFNFKLVFKN